MRTFFEEIWRAISDFKFYKDIKGFSVGKSVKYVLSFILLISLILAIRYSYGLGVGLNMAAEWMKKNLPVIEIQNGIVSVNVEQPYEVSQGDMVVVIDTTGKTSSLDGYKNGVLLMKDKVLYKENDAKTEIYNLKSVKNLRIDENFMNTVKNNAAWIFFPFIFVGIYIYLAIARFLQIFVFSLITIFASAVTKTQLAYTQIFNIGAYAITASMVLGGIAALFMRTIPGLGWAYCGVYIVYLVLGLLNSKETA